MKRLVCCAILAGLLPAGKVWADTRLVFREASWGGKGKDTLVIWQTILLHLNSARINRSYARKPGGFADTTELVPDYTDSVYFLLPGPHGYFSRPLSTDSAFGALRPRLVLSGGTLQEKTLTDKRRIGDTTCVHRQWVWQGGRIDSAGKAAGTADLEFDYWTADKGFKGSEDIGFYNRFRAKTFRGLRSVEGIEAGRISKLVGFWLAEFEKKAQTSRIFPLEMKLTLKRKLAKGQKEYGYLRQTMQISAEQRVARDFMVTKDYRRILAPEARPGAGKSVRGGRKK